MGTIAELNRGVSRLNDSEPPEPTPGRLGGAAFRRTFALLRPHLGGALFVLAMAGVGSACTVFFAWVAGPAIRLIFQGNSANNEIISALHGSGRAALLTLAFGLLSAGLVRAASSYAGRMRMLRIEEEILERMRVDLHDRVITRDLRPRLPGSPAELGARIAYEVQAVRMVLSLGVAGGVNNVAVATGLAILAFRLDALLATLGLVTLPLIALATARLARLARHAQRSSMEVIAALAARASEDTRHTGAIRSAGAGRERTREFREAAASTRATSLRAGRLAALVGPITQFAGAAAAALALFASVTMARPLAPETWISLIATLLLFYQPIRGLSQTAHALSAGLAALDRVQDLEQLSLATTGLETPPDPAAGLFVEDVHFRWSEQSDEVLRGVSLHVRPGETVALVGESGAGKSTLLRIAAGLLECSDGRSSVGGMEIKRLDPEQRAKCIAYVPQEPALFRCSVARNVALADSSPDRQRVLEALSEAGAADFVRRLESGVDTVLSADGGELSAGERQRLCIARALYSGAPILIMDEPTAALDAETEAHLGKTIVALAAQHALLIASHREETIARADRVLTLVEGRLLPPTDEA